MLTETVDLRGRGIVLVAATNFLNRLDSAAIRDGRFDYKIEVPPPDLEARQGLLRRALRRCDVDGDGLARFAARSGGYSRLPKTASFWTMRPCWRQRARFRAPGDDYPKVRRACPIWY
jgi:SpoVK/Ycf46/Vps4 family AAA+-type ATPase